MEQYTLTLLEDRELSVHVSDGLVSAWLPKSQITIIDKSLKSGITYLEVEIPDWLAIDKDLA